MIEKQRAREFDIDHYSPATFKALIDYFYTGKCSIDSNDILEAFEMCQEYMLSDFKQLLEQIMVGNIDMDNFPDNMMLARNFDLKILREAAYQYGKKNF